MFVAVYIFVSWSGCDVCPPPPSGGRRGDGASGGGVVELGKKGGEIPGGWEVQKDFRGVLGGVGEVVEKIGGIKGLRR